MPRTKIVCTIGPASRDEATLRAMLRAGMDVARINFSHGDHPTHARSIALVRRLAEEEGKVVAVMGDLQGPKIRIGELPGGEMALERGERIVLSPHALPKRGEDEGTPSPPPSPPRGRGENRQGERGELEKVIPLPHPTILQKARVGNHLLLADGGIELVLVEKANKRLVAEVVAGGVLRSRQGVNLPGLDLGLSPITQKDRKDLKFALEQGVDYIALSFVRRKEDIEELRRLMGKPSTPIIAKIEKREAVENFAQILKAADGVMVARGDLGLEIPAAEVPLVQKEIIRQANRAAVPVITATQMLESMLHSPRPTRAEASDVANAILDGTDACMLSGETAVGAYPVPAVETVAAIAAATEKRLAYRRWEAKAASVTDAVSQASCEIARELNAKAIITTTSSGYTARMVARHRPPVPIIAVTSREETYRRLALVWGVEPLLVEHPQNTDELIAFSVGAVKKQGIAKTGDILVITAGVPHGTPGRTNLIQVQVA